MRVFLERAVAAPRLDSSQQPPLTTITGQHDTHRTKCVRPRQRHQLLHAQALVSKVGLERLHA